MTSQFRKAVLCALVSLLASANTWSAETPPENYLSPAKGEIVVAPDGSVTSVNIKTRLGLKVVQGMEALIGSWRFKPVADQDAPRRMQMTLLLAAKSWPSQERIQVGIQEARFFEAPQPRYVDGKLAGGSSLPPPKYPHRMRGPHPQARMTMLAHLDEGGNVTEIALVQGWHISSREAKDAHVARWQEAFVASIKAAAKEWVVVGFGESRCVFIPITFSGYDQLWNHARPMRPQPLSGPCAKSYERKEIRVMGDVEPVQPVSKFFPEVWATVAED